MLFKNVAVLSENFSSCCSPKATVLQSLPIVCVCSGIGHHLEMITRVKEDCVGRRYRREAVYSRSLSSTNLRIDQSQAVNSPQTLRQIVVGLLFPSPQQIREQWCSREDYRPVRGAPPPFSHTQYQQHQQPTDLSRN